MRMRQAVLQFIVELYLLYCEYYLPFNCIICSYFSHVNPAGKKRKVNLRFFLGGGTNAPTEKYHRHSLLLNLLDTRSKCDYDKQEDYLHIFNMHAYIFQA